MVGEQDAALAGCPRGDKRLRDKPPSFAELKVTFCVCSMKIVYPTGIPFRPPGGVKQMSNPGPSTAHSCRDMPRICTKEQKKKETDADGHDDPEPIQKREGPCDKGLYASSHQRVGQPKRANLNLITNVDLFTNTHLDSSHILPFPHITASPASPQTQVSPTIHSASSTHRNVRSKPYLVVPLRSFQRRARCGRVKRVDEPRHPHPGRSRQLLAVRKYFRHAELPAIRSPC